MEGEMDGKNLIVFYEDLTGKSISRKQGTCTTYNKLEIILDDRIIIPLNRVVRVEVI